jgi:hypothetical protein
MVSRRPGNRKTAAGTPALQISLPATSDLEKFRAGISAWNRACEYAMITASFFGGIL